MPKDHFSDSFRDVAGTPEVSVSQVNDNRSELNIIDVRTPEEWAGELGHIESSALITLGEDLETYIKGLNKEDEYIIVCRSGKRSAGATDYMKDRGFSKVYNMTGGMIAWNKSSFEIKK